ncbi:DUF6238 family protein [Streptomyces lonarensis]|uniref:DUF6238 family protein n=1 Tax=Streptomyces lonarensis TaxID=700599 RepID=UPI002477053E|nr:DUF6238 family protein [Streptomyces lonarensis]
MSPNHIQKPGASVAQREKTPMPAPLAPDSFRVRDDLDQLHSDALSLARRTGQLAGELDRGDYSAAGGRARTAVTHFWRAAEDLHAAFHRAPPRAAGPAASMARLCGRRMRYLAARVARRTGV